MQHLRVIFKISWEQPTVMLQHLLLSRNRLCGPTVGEKKRQEKWYLGSLNILYHCWHSGWNFPNQLFQMHAGINPQLNTNLSPLNQAAASIYPVVAAKILPEKHFSCRCKLGSSAKNTKELKLATLIPKSLASSNLWNSDGSEW